MTRMYCLTKKGRSGENDYQKPISNLSIGNYNPNIEIMHRRNKPLSGRQGRITPSGLEIKANQQKK